MQLLIGPFGVSALIMCVSWATSLIKGQLQGLLAGGARPRPLHGGRCVSCVASESIKGERGGSLQELQAPQLEGPYSHAPHPAPRMGAWTPAGALGLRAEQARGGGRESSAETSLTQTELLPFVQARCRL